MDVIEFNAETGETTERSFTAAEKAQREADAKAMQDAEAARVKAVQDAQAELKALGLSANAIATISGYPYPYPPDALAV